MNYVNALKDPNTHELSKLLSNFFRNSGAVSIFNKNLYPALTHNNIILRKTYQKKFLLEDPQDINI
jgi:hypothetical protein